ncbi:unnamed protein product [Ectocarpus sp. CCAP 1310/34]|nr:unnamed protein product [Ectocarpus sp. CCAP 1310/34]
MLLDLQHNIYYMPCGDLCATTCLEQTEDQPTYEVRAYTAPLLTTGYIIRDFGFT